MDVLRQDRQQWLDRPLRVVANAAERLFLLGDRELTAIDARTLAPLWHLDAPEAGYSAWCGSGSAVFAADGDLVTVEEGHLVRRCGRSGEVLARAPFAGQLVDAHAAGSLALVLRSLPTGGEVAVIELGERFGQTIWALPALAEAEPLVRARRYDRRDSAAPGDVIRHDPLGVGVVQRVLPRQLVASFAAGGRSLPYRGPPPQEGGAAPLSVGRPEGAPPRRYCAAALCGRRVVVGLLDGSSGDRKVKGVERIELRDLDTGALRIASAPAELECAATRRDDPEPWGLDYSLWASDDRGAILFCRWSAELYEMDAWTGRLRWVAPRRDGYPEAVALDPGRAVAIWPQWRTSSASIEAIDRQTGALAWQRILALPPEILPEQVALAVARGVVLAAWADRELHLLAIDASDGRILARTDRTGRTLPAGRHEVALAPAGGAVIALAEGRGGTLLARFALPIC